MKVSRSVQLYILLPFLFVVIYQVFFAVRIYESESRFIVRKIGDDLGMESMGLSLLGASSAGGMEDAIILREYLSSPNLLDKLQEKIDLRSHYARYGQDFLRYFPENASKEFFLRTFRKRVQVNILPEGGVVRLVVQAYDAKTADQLAQLITLEGEQFVNRVSEELANEQIDFVRQEVQRAEDHLREIRQELALFQNKHAILDPERESEIAISLVASLQSQLVEAKAERIRLLSSLAEGAPEIIEKNQLVEALEQQIEEEKSKLTGSKGDTLNVLLRQFSELKLNSEFALEAYKAAFVSLETARLEASRKLKHFVTLSSTGLPEVPTHPRMLYSLLSSLLIILLVFGVFNLIRATILDHKL